MFWTSNFYFVLLKKIGFASRPDIMLMIYYWQEILLLTLTSFDLDFACGLNRTIEMRGHFENEVALFFFYFCLISFIYHMHGVVVIL